MSTSSIASTLPATSASIGARPSLVTAWRYSFCTTLGVHQRLNTSAAAAFGGDGDGLRDLPPARSPGGAASAWKRGARDFVVMAFSPRIRGDAGGRRAEPFGPCRPPFRR